ncbi:MAG: HD domain-containing protein [Candidatus Omnitrophica bacterium]|nr:HD domain-containing protein [Candidatus Omnitrophota bacterium]
MFSRVEVAFQSLLNCLQTVKMYGSNHPMFQKSLDNAYMAFEVALADHEEIVVGIVGEELAFEKEILFELGKLLRPAILYLKERNIERLAFYRGLNKGELRIFVDFIARPKEEFKGDPTQVFDLAGAEHISIGKLKVGGSKKTEGDKTKNSGLYDSSAQHIDQALNGLLNNDKIDHLALKFSLGSIMESLSVQRNELLKLATLKRYDSETYTHMLNVAIFSLYFSSRLGFDKENVLNIGMSAMFHDIGKIYISRKILHKPGQLTDQEFGRIRSHTFLGAEIMLKYVDTLGILPVVVSFEHHLKYDSTGYPRFPYIKKQHIASSIVSICDVYDALSQRRGYKQDYSPDVVYNIMDKEKGSSFDPVLLNKFFKFVGLWPVGSIVALNDGSIAQVFEQNESDIQRPIVEVVAPMEKKGKVDLLKTAALSISRYLNPWKEGKEYLTFDK